MISGASWFFSSVKLQCAIIDSCIWQIFFKNSLFSGHYPRVQRMIQQHHHSASGTMSESSVDMKINKDGSTSQNNFLVKRRSSDEQGPGGKFKFKDSIRERFSHEFSEAKAENATATSGYFTGSHAHPSLSSSSKVSSSHQEFYAKRRRPSRMECDESGSEVNSSTSQV